MKEAPTFLLTSYIASASPPPSAITTARLPYLSLSLSSLFLAGTPCLCQLTGGGGGWSQTRRQQKSGGIPKYIPIQLSHTNLPYSPLSPPTTVENFEQCCGYVINWPLGSGFVNQDYGSTDTDLKKMFTDPLTTLFETQLPTQYVDISVLTLYLKGAGGLRGG